MNILVYRDIAAACNAASILISAQMIKKPDSIIGFSPNSVWKDVYDKLHQMTRAGLLDWSDIKALTPYERMGAFLQHQEAFSAQLHESLYKKVNLNYDNIRMPRYHQDPVALCAEYDDSLSMLGNLDMLLLEVDSTGSILGYVSDHTFPAAVHLTADEYHAGIITIGIGTIMSTKMPLVLATGKDQAMIIKRILTGTVTPKIPASILQLHPDVIFILDEQAASLL